MLTRRTLMTTMTGAIFAPVISAAETSISTRERVLPDVTLLDQTSRPVNLQQELQKPGPVLLNFIFTTCAGICPMLSAIFAETCDELGEDNDKVRLWSVSIDPTYDTPERLADYAAAFNAPPYWRFLNGDTQDINQVREAFGQMHDSKVGHSAIAFMRTRENLWLSFQGDFTGTMLANRARKELITG